MIRRTILIILSLALVLCVVGCTPSSSHEADFIEITDASGACVKVPRAPENVAVLFSSFADIWQCAGGEISITVGESLERGFASDSAILVDSGAGKTIDVELLISSQPDLVICSADIPAQVTAAEFCTKAGIPALMLRVESFEDYLYTLEQFTKITGRQDLYKINGTDLSSDIQSLITQYRSEHQEISVLFIRAGSGSKSTKAKTADDHFACRMLDDLGTVNIAENAPILLDGLSFEEILLQDPDHIFISTMGDEAAAVSYMKSVLNEPKWQALSAVKNGRVHYLPKELFQYKPNNRWDDAYSYLINILKSQ